MSAPTCRGCGVRIQFGRTEKGHMMPVDMLAADDGNVVFAEDGVHVKVLTKAELAEPITRPRFHSHFTTCPKRKQFQRKSPAEVRAAIERGRAES